MSLPAVNVSSVIVPGVDSPRVTIDLEAVAALAAEHLVSLGLRSFAYGGGAGFLDCVLQHEAFTTRLAAHGVKTVPAFWDTDDDEVDTSRLQAFLHDLPKPVGIFTRGAPLGLLVLQACETAGIAVPDEVAVLAGDDDPLLAEVFSPSLSAVDIGFERIGQRAVELLDAMLAGGQPPKKPVLLSPLGITSRGSTDVYALDQMDVARALHYIRDHYRKTIHIDDLANHVGVSRRHLEYLFRDTLGRTPLEEIRRVRLVQVKNQLVMSDASLKQIAKSCGFTTAEYLIRVFTRDVGMPPGKYRESRRLV